MIALTLIALLLTFPTATDGPDDDKDKKDKKNTIKRVETLAPVTFTPATGYTVKNLTGANGRVWVTGAYGYTERYYDSDSDEQDLGTFAVGQNEFESNGRLTSYILHVGGSYDISRIDDMNISVGADLGLAQRQATADATGVSAARDESSGVAPQNLTLFGEIARPTYTLRAGYLLDLSPEDDLDDDEDYENTDRQDAVLLGLSAQYPATNDVRVFGGFDYFITLEGEGDFLIGAGEAERLQENVTYDEGDLAVLHAGAGYNFGSGEIGVTLLYRINTEGKFGDFDGDDVPTTLGENPLDPSDDGPRSPGTPNQFASGNSLGAVPYVNYTPLGANFQVTLKGAVQTEYFDYGYTFAGKNDIAPRFGFTLGVQYGI